MGLTTALLLTEGYWKQGEHIGGFVIAVIFTVVLVIPYLLYHRKKAHCTAEVDAVVVDLLEQEHTDSEDGYSVTYAPVYSFYFDGQTYRVESKIYSSGRQYEIGEHVTVCVDPENPEKLFDAKRERRTVLYISAISAVFIVSGMIAMLK